MIEKHKYLTLDAIRGVAAFLVLTCHAQNIFGGIEFPHAYLGVDLFFVMSGFVIAVAYDDNLTSKKLTVTNFFKIRAIRLYPLYFLSLVFSILLLIRYGINQDTFNWSGLCIQTFLGLLLIPSPIPLPWTGPTLFPLNVVSWTIFFELIANVIYAKFRIHLTNKTLLYVLGMTAVILCACVFVKHSMNFGHSWKGGIGGFPRVIYSFAAGLMIYRIRKDFQFKTQFNNWFTLLVLSIVILLLGSPVKEYSEAYDLIVVLIFSPVLVLFATYIEPTMNSKTAKVYALLGLTSYAIYILQVPFVAAYSRFVIGESEPTILLACAAVVLFFSLSLLFDLFYDQPIRRWMRHEFLNKNNKKGLG